jgi:hypothetical protein
MSQYGNRVNMTVSGTPGTGNIALGSAVTNYQTFAAAFPTKPSTVAYVATDGSAWEVGTATLDASGGNLTTRTLIESSTGNLISLTSAATVFSDISANAIADLSNHAKQGNLSWTLSGHTGTASSLAGFDANGAATSVLMTTANASGNYMMYLYFGGL